MPQWAVKIMLSLSVTAMLAGALLTGCADKKGAAARDPGNRYGAKRAGAGTSKQR
ncbi:hypothetical protein HMSSN036_61890 [Paenibacillus macerans]|nr:hypothetical protein HMSSN036_61890 [Paenibacillus macerans]